MTNQLEEVKVNIREKVQAHRVNKAAVKYAQIAGEWSRAANLQSINCYAKRDIRALHMLEAFYQNKPFLSCEHEKYGYSHIGYFWQNNAINVAMKQLETDEDRKNFRAWTEGNYRRPVVIEERVLEAAE